MKGEDIAPMRPAAEEVPSPMFLKYKYGDVSEMALSKSRMDNALSQT